MPRIRCHCARGVRVRVPRGLRNAAPCLRLRSLPHADMHTCRGASAGWHHCAQYDGNWDLCDECFEKLPTAEEMKAREEQDRARGRGGRKRSRRKYRTMYATMQTGGLPHAPAAHPHVPSLLPLPFAVSDRVAYCTVCSPARYVTVRSLSDLALKAPDYTIPQTEPLFRLIVEGQKKELGPVLRTPPPPRTEPTPPSRLEPLLRAVGVEQR